MVVVTAIGDFQKPPINGLITWASLGLHLKCLKARTLKTSRPTPVPRRFGALGQDASHSKSPGTKSVEICNSYVLLFFVKDFPLPYFLFNNENGTTYFFVCLPKRMNERFVEHSHSLAMLFFRLKNHTRIIKPSSSQES